MAQQRCIQLIGSTTCEAYGNSSISMDPYLIGLFPFLTGVTDSTTFDTQLRAYVAGPYIQSKYQRLFGCDNISLSNTTNLYARYTFSFICNAIIQNSIKNCNVLAANSAPLCADSCAAFALSEQSIVSSPDLCGKAGSYASTQLRADFTNCALPADSITGSCMPGYANEPSNCGFQSNLEGLCAYCRGSTINSTDSCCVTSNVETRCQGVSLAVYSSLPAFLPSSTTLATSRAVTTLTVAPADTATPYSVNQVSSGLSGGQIAGIVVGAVIGTLLLLGLLICCGFLLRRRRRNKSDHYSLNQPTPPRSGEKRTLEPQFNPLPGARVTRMTAVEGSVSESSPETGNGLSTNDGTSPESFGRPGPAGAAVPPRAKSRNQSPDDSPEYSSPGGPSDSEQMPFFKDYYSSDEIHPGDQVSTLWAYAPRANDEWELERGDMLTIVGIWDDGWATGVRIDSRADEWEPRNTQRDSGVSGGSRPDDSPPSQAEVKAFPLVCVCVPQHWRKTIEGDSSEPGASDDPPGT